MSFTSSNRLACIGALFAAAFLHACTRVQAEFMPPKPGANDFVAPSDYSDISRVFEEKGVVTLSVVVDAKGNCKAARVKRSSGSWRLDETAVDTCRRKFTWQPATQNGKPVEASIDMRLALRAPPPPPSPPGEKALRDAFDAVLYRDWDRVIALATQAIDSGDLHPPTARAYQARGGAYLRKFRYADAVADADRMLELHPGPQETASAYRIRAIGETGLRRYDAAIADFTRGLAVLPAQDQNGAFCWYIDQGFAYRMKGESARADAAFAQAARREPDHARNLYCFGAAKMKFGDKSGRADMLAAKKLKPDIESDMLNRGEGGF